MTSLLSSIFGDAPHEETATSDLFANRIAVPPPLPPAKLSSKSKNRQEKDESMVPNDGTEGQSELEVQSSAVASDNDDNAAKMDDGMDNNVENHSADDNTVFVGNLPFATTRKDLTRIFRDCGKIISTRIRSVAINTEKGVKLPPHLAGNQKLVKQILVNQHKVDPSIKSTVQGYVVFQDTESVEKALLLNNTPIPDKAGEESGTLATRRMRVDRVNKEYDARRSLFIGNLPYQADEESLRACFVQSCNWDDTDIHGVRIVRDKQTHQCKGFGYLLTADASMIATALRTMEGIEYMGRPLRVRVCGKRFKTRSADNNNNNNHKSTSSSINLNSDNKPTAKVKPVAEALRQLVSKERQDKQNKRKRGNKKTAAHSTGKSKRAASEAKTLQRIKKIEKRIQKGMGKARKR